MHFRQGLSSLQVPRVYLQPLLVLIGEGCQSREPLWRQSMIYTLCSLSERAWRKRVERAQEWISWSASSPHRLAAVTRLVAKDGRARVLDGCEPIENASGKRRGCETAQRL